MVKKGLVYNLLYQLLNICIPLITTPYLSRILGPEGIGIYSFYYSIAGYFVLFAMLGISNYGSRCIAVVKDDKNKLSKTFWNLYAMQLLIASIILLLYILFALMTDDRLRIYIILNGVYVLSALVDINWFFVGIEQFKLTVVRNVIVKVISLASIFFFIKTPQDLNIYILIIGLSVLVSAISLWGFLFRFIEYIRPQYSEIIVHLKPNVILFIPILAVSLYKMMDKIMIGWLSNKVENGYYEQAEKIINIPSTISTAFGTVMLPRISNLVAKGKDSIIKNYIRDSMQFLMAIIIPMSFGIAAVAPNFVPVFLGEEFRNSIRLVEGLTCTITFVAWASVIRTQYLIPREEDNVFLISSVIGAIVNVIINSLLIKKFGAWGAVIGTIAAEFAVAFIQTYYASKELQIKRYIVDSICFIPSAIIMFIVVRAIGIFLGETVTGIILQIAVGILVYALFTTLLIKLFCKERFEYLKSKISFLNRGKK